MLADLRASRQLAKTRKRRRLLRIAGVTLVTFLLAGTVLYWLMPDGLARCYLVRVSALDRIELDVYVDPQMPESQRQRLLSSLAASKERVAALYGAYTAQPIIIAGHTMDVMEAYGGAPYNRAGRAYLTLAATFIILGPGGTLSADVMSHELAHAEWSARIGHRHRASVPNWFDEGLAVQFDERYSEAEWQTKTDGGRTAPDLDQMGIIQHNDWLAYATAKHEVRRWLNVVGQEGLEELLQAVQTGEAFDEAYHSLEEAYRAAP